MAIARVRVQRHVRVHLWISTRDAEYLLARVDAQILVQIQCGIIARSGQGNRGRRGKGWAAVAQHKACPNNPLPSIRTVSISTGVDYDSLRHVSTMVPVPGLCSKRS